MRDQEIHYSIVNNGIQCAVKKNEVDLLWAWKDVQN